METLTKKIENRKSEKRYKNNDFVQYLIKNPEYLTNASTLNMNGTIGTTAYHDIYDELRDLLTEKHDLPRPYTQVFQEICGINKPTDFISTLDAMQQKHTQGKRNDEEVNDIMTHFSTELVRGNKSKLRFPYIKEQCEQRFAGHIDREAIATKQQVIINNKRTVPEKR